MTYKIELNFADILSLCKSRTGTLFALLMTLKCKECVVIVHRVCDRLVSDVTVSDATFCVFLNKLAEAQRIFSDNTDEQAKTSIMEYFITIGQTYNVSDDEYDSASDSNSDSVSDSGSDSDFYSDSDSDDTIYTDSDEDILRW